VVSFACCAAAHSAALCAFEMFKKRSYQVIGGQDPSCDILQ
jgi:hypothetical protein